MSGKYKVMNLTNNELLIVQVENIIFRKVSENFVIVFWVIKMFCRLDNWKNYFFFLSDVLQEF